jgi:predicted SAM-dependent methyltransferase
MNTNDICLNIGSSVKAADGWENIDASPSLRISKIPIVGRTIVSLMKSPNWHNLIKYGDVLKGLKVEENSCRLVYASHVLEHLSLADFHVAVDNIYSYLKPEGVFRTIVPDLETYISAYVNTRLNSTLSHDAAHQFMSETWTGNPGSRKNFNKRFREAFSNSRHQWMWDEPSLSKTLEEHGFKNIRRCSYGIWSDPKFKFVEQEYSHENAICLEATK